MELDDGIDFLVNGVEDGLTTRVNGSWENVVHK